MKNQNNATGSDIPEENAQEKRIKFASDHLYDKGYLKLIISGYMRLVSLSVSKMCDLTPDKDGTDEISCLASFMTELNSFANSLKEY